MKRILVYYNWQLFLPFYGIIIDHMRELADREETEFHFLSCDGILKNCLMNRENDPRVCELCRFTKKAGQSSMPSNMIHHTIENWIPDHLSIPKFSYSNTNDIKRLTYKGVQIGFGALSSYVSYTRNLEPVMDEAFHTYFDLFLYSQVRLSEALNQMNNEIQFDEVVLYNGRWADVRPVFDFFTQRDIPVQVLESVNNGSTEYDKEVYMNVLPQNIANKSAWINRVWEESELALEEREAIANDYYERKRSGQQIRGDIKIFISQQDAELLPEGWDLTKINIAIFNSSEDEFVALGEDWELFRIFPSQEKGIGMILEQFADRPEYHFYLRNHPNLSSIQYGYVNRLLELEKKYPNITVIPPDSPVSTYKLVDVCEKVLVFGSSVGVEANYFRKPVILLGGTLYYELDVAYIADSVDKCMKLISSDLSPKPLLGAQKFAFFVLNHRKYTQRISMNPEPLKIVGIQVAHVFDFLKVGGNRLLFRVLFQFRRIRIQIMDKIHPLKTRIPVKGH